MRRWRFSDGGPHSVRSMCKCVCVVCTVWVLVFTCKSAVCKYDLVILLVDPVYVCVYMVCECAHACGHVDSL